MKVSSPNGIIGVYSSKDILRLRRQYERYARGPLRQLRESNARLGTSLRHFRRMAESMKTQGKIVQDKDIEFWAPMIFAMCLTHFIIQLLYTI